MKRKLFQFVLLLALFGSPSARAGMMTNPPLTTASGNSTNTPATASYIVTLRREADQDGCAKDFNIQRHHIYRHALNGFSANLDAAMVEKLKRDPRVQEVERDGRVVLCSQTPSTGFVRMGLTNFPEDHING